MKKTIIALAIALFGIGSFNASAQQDKMYRPQTFTDFAFEGVLLSVEQQAAIDSLNQATFTRPERPCAKMCTGDTATCHKKKAECKKQDKKVDGKKCHKGNKAVGEMRCPGKHGKHGNMHHGLCPEKKQEYIKKVKEILTPEQYTVFLENIVNMPVQEKQAMQGAPDVRGPRTPRTR